MNLFGGQRRPKTDLLNYQILFINLIDYWRSCPIYIHRIKNKGTLVFLFSFYLKHIQCNLYGVQVNIGCDLHMQQHLSGTCQAYWGWYGVHVSLPFLLKCNTKSLEKYKRSLLFGSAYIIIFEPRHVISNNVAFRQVQTQTSLCSLLLSLETPNDVWSVA